MKRGMRWMALAVVALVATSAWAVFNPDTDGNLKFNLNFETNPTAFTTTDAKAGFTGQVKDQNSVFSMWKTGGVRGKYADFNQPNDIHSGADGNDCAIDIPGTTGSSIFEFGDGWPGNEHTTFAFWFNMPSASEGSGTFFRHTYIYDPTYFWEVRAIGGKLDFRHSQNCIRFETTDTLSALGVTGRTWHHAVVVIDRTTRTSSKMYIDGLEAPTTVTYFNSDNMNMDTYPYYDSPLTIGAGQREFDGLLDELRIYDRILSPLDVSLLYQYNPAVVHTTAILPIPRSSNVPINTDVEWVPSTGATAQNVYFGTNPAALTLKKTGDGTLAAVTDADLGGPFPLNTTYYWYVKSTIGGVDSNSPVWSFTTETGKAFNPSPADGAEDIEVSDVNVSWTGSATALSYDVYYSTNKAKVIAKDPTVKIATGITSPLIEDVNTASRGADYYWCVVSNFSTGSQTGDIWTFRARGYEIVFNTCSAETRYEDHGIPAYGCLIHGDGWLSVPGFVSSALDVNTVVFTFSSFNFDRRYDVTVVPEYRPQDINAVNVPRPIQIKVTSGNFYFDGRIRINGDDVLLSGDSDTRRRARSGGYPGPRYNSGEKTTAPDVTAWSGVSITQPYPHRFGGITSSDKTVYIPTDYGRTIFGPGLGVIPPYKGGGGGGAGGNGGNCGRGYFFGMVCGGPSYGDKEVPVAFGGSGGGWGNPGPGAPGGGGIEIVVPSGNVVLDSNSEIRANGGNSLYTAINYPGGGGGGGAVKIIASGSVTNKGNINANGGSGGNTNKQANEAGGGGGGGRVAIFYNTSGTGGTYSNTGVITARGGGKGVFPATGASLADDGKDGTIYVVNSSTVSPKKASAPTPKNGDKKFYIGSSATSGTITLRWYSGYGAGSDVVKCDDATVRTNPTTVIGSPVTATRAGHTMSLAVTAGHTYYWKVTTDSTVDSDVWSFKVVNWQCPAAGGTANRAAGPLWDCNGDCFVNFEDLATFARDWWIPRVSADQDYTLDNTYGGTTLPADGIASDLARFASEWMQCINRTNGGCTF